VILVKFPLLSSAPEKHLFLLSRISFIRNIAKNQKSFVMNSSLYEQDFYTWSKEQSKALTNHQVDSLDWEYLAEELADLGNRHYDQLNSRLAVLIGHLLKWKYQPDRQSHSWKATIREQRRKIARLLQRNPGLKNRWQEALEEAWLDGRDLAIRETSLDESLFPEEPCFSSLQIQDPDYWP
jgi:ribosomal protein L29